MSNAGAALDKPTSGSSKLRRRFLLAGVAGLAVLGPILGISFLGDTGTSSLSITPSTSSSLVYTSSLPCDMFGSNPASTTAVSLRYGTTATYGSGCSGSASATYQAPSWTPAAGSAGAVTSGGDLALIDASGASSNVILDVYITNLQDMAADYSSFAFPINIYSCASACSTASAWTAVSGDSSYITSSGGFYSVSLPAGAWYDLTIESGGEYYCVATTTSGLAPSFFITASNS